MHNILPLLSEATGLALGPTNTILLRNVGTSNHALVEGSDHATTRGFNLLLLDPGGQPRHYVKCRLSNSQRAIREADVYAHVSNDPELSAHVAGHSVHQSQGMQLLLCDFLRGQSLHSIIRKSPASARRALLHETLDVTESIAALIRSSGASFSTVDYEKLLSKCPNIDNEAIDEALRRVTSLDCEYQHGDLSGANVLIVRDKPVLIDFEAYAEIKLPLFDAWSLVRSTSDAFGDEPWWRGEGARFVHDYASKKGLSREDINATAVTFAAVMGAMICSRGVIESWWRSYFSELSDMLATWRA
jgi:serine/threonine protein kinase